MIRTIAIAALLCSHCAAATLPAGLYVMQAVDRQNVGDGILSDPRIAGLHLRSEWGTENLDFLATQAERVIDAGKHFTLGVYAGVNSSPAWVSKSRPWLATDRWVKYVAVLGVVFANEPALDAVHMSAPVTNNSMEMYLPPGLAPHSDADIINSWKRSIDAFSSAFPNKTLVLDIAMVPDSRGAITRAVDEYARSTLGDRFEAIICSLKADTSRTAPHIVELERLRAEGVRIGLEFASPSSDRERFGGSFAQALKLGNSLGGQWYQMYQSDVQYLPRLSARPLPEPSCCALLLTAALCILPRTRKCSAQ